MVCHGLIGGIGGDGEHKDPVGHHNPVDAMGNPKPHPLFVSRSHGDLDELGVMVLPFARIDTFFLSPRGGW